MYFSMLVVYIVVSLRYKDVESANLTITPSTNVQAGSSALTIRCSAASGLGITNLYNIQVKRTVYSNTCAGTELTVGSIDVGSTATLGSGFTQPKYTATGSLPSITQVSGSYLQIVIQYPDCTDQAEYTCRTVAGNNQGIISPTPAESKNVIVQSNPGNLNMYAVPERSTYNVNQTVTLTCKGDTGNPRKIWSWQTQRFSDSTKWERYPDNNDIKDGIIIPPSGNKCSYSQETVLTYVVKATDNGLTIRCILDNMDEYSVNKTIYTNFKPIENKPGGNTGNPDSINMFAVPERSTYNVNQTVTLTCKGDTVNPRKIWSWQTQIFPYSTRWERYPDNNHIKDGNIIPPSGTKCSYSQETVLTYVVKATDNGLRIRCILDNFDEYSVSKHIYIIFDMVTESQACATGIPVSGDKLGEGIWIGFVIGGIVATIVTTVIFCFILRKSKAKSGEYGTVRYDEPDISRTNQRVAYVPNINVNENQPNHYNVLLNPDPPTISEYEHLKNYENVTNPESNNPSYLNMQQ